MWGLRFKKLFFKNLFFHVSVEETRFWELGMMNELYSSFAHLKTANRFFWFFF